ncbi:MAG: Mur ligase domain-containing protein [Spirochaetes bacterium]|nr:Mur ligase domain-containing protein [Spirochaetota bacterium]
MKDIFLKQTLRIHMIGICGVGMSALAGMLQEQGHIVSGSDTDMYPPISTQLETLHIPLFKGYCSETVEKLHPDMVIIGNAISRGNPEVEAVLNKRIPYFSMAQSLYYFFLWDKEVIGVAGTHGKTTTTSLLAYILDIAGMQPSFFIGGIPKNYGKNYNIGQGKYFVIEADEYDSAYFEKIPKFIVYRPTHCIMTSLEFDHADIYKNLDEIILWFTRLKNIIPANGHIVYNAMYQPLCAINSSPLSVTKSYGKTNADCWYQYEAGKLTISMNGKIVQAQPKIFGNFNYHNIAGAAAMALSLGISEEAIAHAIDSFEGVKRRQEILFSSNYLTIIEDFAHHPTAIKNVLYEVSQRYPGSKIIALYEPRSATSRRNVFQNELPLAFLDANCVIMKRPYRLDKVPQSEQIDIERVVHDIRSKGIPAHVFETVDAIVDEAFNRLNGTHTVMVVMSNGGFDGIYDKLVSRAQKLYGTE